MTEREELKPCPFCGGVATRGYFPLDIFSVGCESDYCAAQPLIVVDSERAAEAIAAWNRRAEG